MFNQLLTTIMKKNLWMLAAALCMTACSQNEDIVIEQPVSDNDFESPTTTPPHRLTNDTPPGDV